MYFSNRANGFAWRIKTIVSPSRTVGDTVELDVELEDVDSYNLRVNPSPSESPQPAEGIIGYVYELNSLGLPVIHEIQNPPSVVWASTQLSRFLYGLSGVYGSQGSQGSQGVQGPRGVPGVVGNTGDPGEKGLQGVQGPQGMKGDAGLTYASWTYETNITNLVASDNCFFETMTGASTIALRLSNISVTQGVNGWVNAISSYISAGLTVILTLVSQDGSSYKTIELSNVVTNANPYVFNGAIVGKIGRAHV
jgi:hypothetical protein